MSKKKMAMILVPVLAVLLAAGYVVVGKISNKGPEVKVKVVKRMSPEEIAEAKELIWAKVEAYQESAANRDLDGAMALMSENFGGGGSGKKEFLRKAWQETLDKIASAPEVIIAGAEIDVEHDTATVFPVELYIPNQEPATIEFFFTKEEGGWMITDMDFSAGVG